MNQDSIHHALVFPHPPLFSVKHHGSYRDTVQGNAQQIQTISSPEFPADPCPVDLRKTHPIISDISAYW